MRGSTTANPAVADSDEEVDPNAMYDAHEISFPSNPRLVFHDSRGFEAGSTEEIDDVWRFEKQRSTCTELKDRLRVIWYCVSMDQPQVLSKAESPFFENGAGDGQVVCVIVQTRTKRVASRSASGRSASAKSA
ncbi:hypothetical protein FRC02_004997 [Tulasnella sp. 418]|nr:hypothetical protein FRC02_004997 [Tulasnella sp. 418]